MQQGARRPARSLGRAMRHCLNVLLLLIVLGGSHASQASGIPSCDGKVDRSVSKSQAPVSAFRSITPGSSRHEVHRLVGEPGCLAGSGIAYDVYLLADGRRVWIAYPDGNARWAYLESDGERREWLFGDPADQKR